MPLQQQFADFVNLTLLEDFSGKKSPVLSRLEFLCLYRFASFDPEYAFSSVGPLTGDQQASHTPGPEYLSPVLDPCALSCTVCLWCVPTVHLHSYTGTGLHSEPASDDSAP